MYKNLDVLDNIMLLTDSYKITHYLQYPNKTQYVYSYFESRGGKFNETVFFGLQYVIKKWLTGPVVSRQKIEEAKEILKLHFAENYFNEDGWKYILEKWNGYLPIRIKAVPEGTVVPVKNVLFTVENTDPNCYWLTNYVETILVQTWYSVNVATISYEMKKVIAKYLVKTADNTDGLLYKLHDFGFRGCSSVETASIGSVAHLVNFKGTDTLVGLLMAKRFYNEKMAGESIAASEHSTITSWGKDNECSAFKNMLTTFPNKMVSCVSDSFDIWKACEQYWGTILKDKIEVRNQALVIRPDSGDPVKLLPKIFDILGKQFGFTVNLKGFKLLPPYLRLIQGDGITVDSLESICQCIMDSGWSLDNIAFGCGGGLLQRHDRDTQKIAFKCSFVVVDGEGRNVFKDPITDSGKKSKVGRLVLEKTGSSFITREEGLGSEELDCLLTVFENGRIVKDYSLDEVRKNVKSVF